ncbi:MAG: sugar ABC transporter permease [Chloroflexi bacterium]|jgi:arabinogalactan oligomer/maltooligosaccharide transport system permease protein|nr:sugar ABC transporter permease [Chloroflexota bacterium]MBP8059380.1 sugar ABC transporter permease [Chloroflexota bacterium]
MSMLTHPSRQPSRKTRRFINQGLKYLLATGLVIFAIFPAFWVISASFNPAKSLIGGSLWPKDASLGNYNDLLQHEFFPYTTWLANSFKIAVISVTIIIFITCLTGYALSRFRFTGRRHLMTAILILNVFPAILAIVALFAMMQQIGTYVSVIGFNTHGGLIFVYVAGAMGINVLMMKAYIDAIPIEVDESALVDGATHWQLFWRIIFPMIRPIVITIAVLSFFAIYGDFIIARVLLKNTDKLTVMVGLMLFQTSRFDQDWGIITAGAVMAALPVVLIYLPLQNYVISGLTSGSVKG